jgi:hypothetical protein
MSDNYYFAYAGRPRDPRLLSRGHVRLLRRLRYWFRARLGFLVGAQAQTCKDCWRTDGIDFHADTAIWNAVVAPPGADLSSCEREGWGGVFCLECFDRRAEARDIDYRPGLVVYGRHCWLVELPRGGDYRRAIGALDGYPLLMSPEEAVRRVRDRE